MQFIFGPVNSRRFGRSLGVDLSPAIKQCNFDCLYCELAPAAPLPKQQSVIEPHLIIKELQKHLHDNIDVITITANGEPTLYPYLNELIKAIDAIKKDTKTLILSNGSLLDQKAVFETLFRFDMVKLSLDAVSEKVFKKIDRPYKELQIATIVDSMKMFSKVYVGELYIEILFVEGINDSKEEIALLNKTLLEFSNITRIDIGTIDRPPAYPVHAIDFQKLHNIANLFDATLPIHIVSKSHNGVKKYSFSAQEILNTLDKRPLTREDIEALFDEKSLQILENLLKENKIVQKSFGKVEFYIPIENSFKKRLKNS